MNILGLNFPLNFSYSNPAVHVRFAPGNSGPERFGPGRFAPGRFGPGRFAPGLFGPGRFVPGRFGPERFVPGLVRIRISIVYW